MFETLPADPRSADELAWSQIEPYYEELAARPIDSATVELWLHDWSRLYRLLSEVGVRRHLAYDGDTRDGAAERRYLAFIEEVATPMEAAEQRLRRKLLDSGLRPAGMEVPLRDMGAVAALFREENLPLLVEETRLGAQYDKLVGGQSVVWEGRETPIPQLQTVLEDPDRARRERAWWLMRERQLADREAINGLWQELLALRRRIAANAGHGDVRGYSWQAYRRFDYGPEDCHTFHEAIAAVAVPAATRVYERRARRLGVPALRPWDLSDGSWRRPADPPGRQPLRPYRQVGELLAKSDALFQRLDPQLGERFASLGAEELLDLESRPGKAPGGYCTYLAVARRPFIFMNAAGTHTDLQTLLHEAGHAFHAFAMEALPYHQQLSPPMEFNEVAAMAMELLAAPYLSVPGGFYSEAEAARARVEHLEEMLLFWPYMAVVDSFQHWAYTSPDEAADPKQCDARWQALWNRFIPGVDWSGLEAELVTGWQRRLHIFRVPFYYVEYGLAALGAAQIWRNARGDHAGALAAYRRALALGGTAALPELYATAGARFAFDEATLGGAVALIEETIAELETPTP
jgi:oligoendopeptidase F